jgi:hypothetical protein
VVARTEWPHGNSARLSRRCWGPALWILVALAAFVLAEALGAVNGLQLATMGRSEQLSPRMVAMIRGPWMLVSWRARVALVLGIVFLMTEKPIRGAPSRPCWPPSPWAWRPAPVSGTDLEARTQT